MVRLAPPLLGSALIIALALAVGAHAATVAAFRATCTGQASAVAAGSTGHASASGSCRGAVFGTGTFTGSAVGDTSHPPCVPFTGHGAIRSALGTITMSAPTGARGCAGGQAGAVDVAFSGTALITGGSGKFRQARGTVAFSGTYQGSSHAITIKLNGTIHLHA
jgi:hypothetical protein